MTTIANLRALHAAATPAPWPLVTNDEGRDEFYCESHKVGPMTMLGVPRPDTELIAAMRNALPALLDIAEAARESIRCVEWVAGEWGEPPVPCVRLSRSAFEALSAKLAALEAKQ